MTFEELNLSAPVLRAVREAGYTVPSPIQAAAIPPVLAGRDLMGCAQTGTGKTAAFGLPMLDRLAAAKPKKPGAVRALILTPTRELALQIGESFAAYGKYLPLRSTVIFGGVGQAPQVQALRSGVEILVACPGRLNDLIGQGHVDLSGVEIFVLDEADRMLDMGFVHDVKKVIAKLPPRRQNLMFSATMPAEIEQLAAGILHDPAFVKVDPVSSTVDRIRQSLYYVEKGNKKLLLPWLIQNLNDPPVTNALVFSRTKHGADKIARDLVRYGLPVMLNELLWSVAISMHSVILGHMSSDIVAANSICNVMFQMATSIILGVSNASAVLVGMLVGRGDYPYARACVNKLIQIYAVIGVVCAALLLAVKGPVIGIYDIKESTRVLTDQLMYVYAAAIFFMAFTCPLISGVLRGAGDTRFAAVTDVGCIWAMVPLGAAAAFWLGAPPVLVLAVLKCDMPLKAFFCLRRIAGGNWIRNVTR